MSFTQHAACVILCACCILGCSKDEGQSQDSSGQGAGGVTGKLLEPDPGKLQQDRSQWAMTPGNYASTRFSALDEINAGNVARLRVAWTFSTGMVAGHEAAPLVVGSTMYLV